MAAFARAHALGVDGFELDVRLSRDGEVMVIHDADVDRTTNGSGRVSALNAAELRALDAGCRFKDSREISGESRIPLLRDVLARFPEEMLIIELKGANPALPPRAFEIVREAGALDRVCFGGFADVTLEAVRRVAPPLLNDLVALQKDVGLISLAGPVDAIRAAQIRTAETYDFTPYVVAGALFVLLAIPLIAVTDWVTLRAARRQSAEMSA